VYTAYDAGMLAKADAKERDHASALGKDATVHSNCLTTSDSTIRCETLAAVPLSGGYCGDFTWTAKYVVESHTGAVLLDSPGDAKSGDPYTCDGSADASPTDPGPTYTPPTYTPPPSSGPNPDNEIPNYPNGHGTPVPCADGQWSQSGGIEGACSHHGGEAP